jgi:hypothetical protein
VAGPLGPHELGDLVWLALEPILGALAGPVMNGRLAGLPDYLHGNWVGGTVSMPRITGRWAGSLGRTKPPSSGVPESGVTV